MKEKNDVYDIEELETNLQELSIKDNKNNNKIEELEREVSITVKKLEEEMNKSFIQRVFKR